MATQVDYFEPGWREKVIDCECGWEGRYTEMNSELFRELMQADCPKCERILLLIAFPTMDDIQRAADQGNPEALSQLEDALAARQRAQARALTQLVDARQLPDLAGETLAFVGDVEIPEVHGCRTLVIRCGDAVVWRETIGFEDWQRFNELRAILRLRYGARYHRFLPTDAAEGWFYGDDLSAAMESRILQD